MKGIECISKIASTIEISTLAILRQPCNVWLWVYLFDDDGGSVAVFCGHDDLDAFARYMDDMSSDSGITSLYSNINVSAINNFAQKKEALASNYIKFMRNNIMSGYDLHDYVAALSEDDDTFFSWLFDDISLRGCRSWELSDKQNDDWVEFYNSFSDD